MQQMVEEIHDVVYDVEDIIDVFVTKNIEKNHKTRFFKFFKQASSLHSIGRRVEEIKGRVVQLRADIKLPSIEEDKDYKHEIMPPRKKDAADYVDVKEELIGRLTQETDYFDVVSLIGMPGVGKTTLAWKIFENRKIVFKFGTRIWLPVSQQLREKEIFLRILSELTTLDDVIRAKDEQQLAELVAAYLDNGNFLIVMDDVWSEDAWYKLRSALPFGNNKGKVLITSRFMEVGEAASKPRPVNHLRFFTREESWELLRLEALGKLDCPPELEHVGRIIAENCDGFPLAIVVIGGILATMSSGSNIAARRKDWEQVSTHMRSYLSEDDPGHRMQKIISLSYENLPYHSRACFLYLGFFPEDYEIPVSKLIRMWIGEGFIPHELDCSLEETAHKFLEDLISRNLVISVKFKLDGRVKTCQIHDILRDFCLTEARAQNFLQEIKYTNDGQCVPPISSIDTYRRLSIHSNCLNFISSRPFGPRIRSFVCFSEGNYVVSPENSTNIIEAFKLVRVLDVMPFKFTKIDSDLYNLVHMRYIALSSELSILPSKFNQLRNIQTLIVDTTSLTLEVKADIWKMKHLRHFKTNASATLPKTNKDSEYGVELQTLGTISAESCTAELFQRACNLNKLGIRGRLALLLEGKIGSFDSLGKVKCLEKMKLVNDVHPRPASEGQLRVLPQPYQFPSKLRSLTLVATFLSWNFMSTLGLLENLEVLKLKDKAFMGRIWTAVNGGFRRLEVLHIEETDLTVWEATSHQFPRLRGLVLKNCEELRGIPILLAEVASFQMLELYVCRSATPSAKRIHEAKMKTQGKVSAFRLSIFPPTD